jgi:hypothetical protein
MKRSCGYSKRYGEGRSPTDARGFAAVSRRWAPVGASVIFTLASCVAVPLSPEREVASPGEAGIDSVLENRNGVVDSSAVRAPDGDEATPLFPGPNPTVTALDPPPTLRESSEPAIVPEEPIPPEPSVPIDVGPVEIPSPEYPDDVLARLLPPVPIPPPIGSGAVRPAGSGSPGAGAAPSAAEVVPAAGEGATAVSESDPAPTPTPALTATGPQPPSGATREPEASDAPSPAPPAAPPPIPAERPSIVELPPIAIRLSRTGITVPVTLDGFGWIYLADSDADGFVFVGRELTDTASIFGFRIDRPGDYSLRFQRQDNEVGRFEVVTVEILGTDAPVVPGSTRAVPETRPTESPAPAASDEVESTVADAETITARAGSGGEEAYSLYREVLERLGGDDRAYPYNAVVGVLLEYAVLRELAEYLTLAEILETGGYLHEAVATLVAAIERYGRASGVDAACFRLARIFEGDSPLRDEKRALGYYRKITEYFPLSAYYEEAQARIRHIERHFIDIR